MPDPLTESLDLAPEDELFIIYEPTTAEAWGWGHSERAARAFARLRLDQLDASVAPLSIEEPHEVYLQRCAVLRVTVSHSDALDLLRLLGLQTVAPPASAC